MNRNPLVPPGGPIARPGDFPLGSLESRAAARLALECPAPGAPVRWRFLGRGDYGAHVAAQRAGKVFPYVFWPEKAPSAEVWVQWVKEDMAELDREREAEKLKRSGPLCLVPTGDEA